MNMKKIVAVASALSLTAAIAIGGTLAYLTKGTQEVKNTFTYSTTAQNIDLDLNEHKLSDDKVTVTGDVTKTNAYTVLPGVNVEKDPYLTLTTENPSYIYVEIVNNAGSVVDKIYDNYPGTIEFGGVDSAWTELQGVTGPNGGKVYVWNDSMTAGTTEENNIPVFESITFKNDAPTQDVNAETTNISVFGYAIATTGMGDYTQAWNTASGDFQAQIAG